MNNHIFYLKIMNWTVVQVNLLLIIPGAPSQQYEENRSEKILFIQLWFYHLNDTGIWLNLVLLKNNPDSP